MTVSVRDALRPLITALREKDPSTRGAVFVFALIGLPGINQAAIRPGQPTTLKGLLAAVAATPVSVATATSAPPTTTTPSGPRPSPPTSPGPASVGVELNPQGPTLTVVGRGFSPGESIGVTVTSRETSPDGPGPPGVTSTSAVADGTGGFRTSVGVRCRAGVSTTHTATAHGTTSGRSGSAGAAC